MTDYSPLLHLPLVAPNQEQKEATINTALAILEAAMNDTLQVPLTGTTLTLNDDQFTKYFHLQFTGTPGAPVTVSIPNTRRWFAAENLTAQTVTLKVLGSVGSLTVGLPAGKIGLLMSDGNDIRFVVPDPVSGLGLLNDLSDVSGIPTNGQYLRWVEADLQWKPATLTVSWATITDTPAYNVAAADKLLAVKADGSGLEWVTSAANINSFVDLDDTPTSYTGQANKTLVVNTAATGVTFATPSIRGMSDAPNSFIGGAGKYLKVNAASSAVEYGMPKVADLTDGPGQSAFADALTYVRVNAAGTGLEYAPGTGGPVNFIELNDTPNSFVGQKNKLVRVAFDEDQLFFDDFGFLELKDTPTTYAGFVGKFTRVNASQTGLEYASPSVQDLSNGPGAFSGKAKQVVRVNSTTNALEYVALSVVDLAGFPSGFAGQGGKYLQVRADEAGIQFVTTTYTTSFLALTDTPAAYTGKQNQMVVVDPAASGLTFRPIPTIPTRLGQLADVEDGTGTPTQGQFLRWIDGVWQADTFIGGGGSSNVKKLGDLDDVEAATGIPPEGYVLTWKGGVWQAEPGATGSSDVQFLPDLDDVTIATPASGQILTYRSGQWINEDPFSTGVPSNGSHLHWRLLISAVDGSPTNVGIQEISFRQTKTGPVLSVGGTPTASTERASNQGPAGAFDGVIDGAWFSANGNIAGAWIAYAFLAPVEVRYLDLMGSQSETNSSPKDFDVQWSDDGVTWTTAWSVTGQNGWAPSQIRQYHAPLDLFFTDLADVPPSYIGQAQKIVRVKSDEQGLEFGDNTLGNLADVENGTGTPPSGYVLTWNGGVWQPEPSVGANASNWTAPWRGARAKLTALKTGLVLTSDYIIPWDVVDIDSDAVWNSANKTRLTVPAGVTKVRVKTSVGFEDLGVLGGVTARITKNGSSVQQGRVNARQGASAGFTTNETASETPVLSVIPGDYFEVIVRANMAGQDQIQASVYTWFELEVVETTYAINPPEALGDLTDVEMGTGVPVEGYVLTWKNGVWQAEPGGTGSSNVDSIGDLSDVEMGTGVPVEGYVLTWKDGVWQAEPGGTGSSNVQVLNDLDDVSIPTGLPIEGQTLVYQGGAWTSITPSVRLDNARVIVSGVGAPTALLPRGSLYLQEDTGDQYISRPTVEGLDIVQSQAAVLTGGTLGVTFATPPTEGNWLVAFTGAWSGFATTAPGPEWTELADDGGQFIASAIFYRRVAANEDSTVTVIYTEPFNDTVAVFEVAGIGDTWASAFQAYQAHGDLDDPVPVTGTPYSATADFTLALAAVTQRSVGGEAPPSLDGSWAEDASATDPVIARQIVAGHLANIPNATSTQIESTLAATATDYAYGIVYLTGAAAYGSGANWVKVQTEGAFALGDLSNVETGTGTPTENSVLTWKDGVWQAEPAAPPPFIPHTLGQLDDVEAGTGTPAENATLTWKNGVWQAEPAAPPPFIPHTLGQLDDVEAGTGTPAENSSLTWKNGVWQAEPKPFIPLTLGQLDDVEAGTGVPAANSVLTWKNGVWQAEPAAPAPFIPHTLGQLDDVEAGTGTPAENTVLTWKNGVWQAEPLPTIGGISTLAELLDVDVDPLPQAGQMLTYNAETSKWEPFYKVGPGYWQAWRIKINAAQTAAVSIARMEFYIARDSEGDISSEGTPIAGNTASGSSETLAFDGNNFSSWVSAPIVDFDTWLGMWWGSGVRVRAVRIYMSPDAVDELGPLDFEIQYGDGEIPYKTAWRVTDEPAWSPGDVRTFKFPNEGHISLEQLSNVAYADDGYVEENSVLTWADGDGGYMWRAKPAPNFLGLADTPDSYGGNANKLVAVDSGEFGLTFSDVTVDHLRTLPDTGKHAFWRLKVMDVAYMSGNEPVRFALAGLDFRATLGGPTLIGGGTPFGTAAYDDDSTWDGTTPANLFDGDSETFFVSDVALVVGDEDIHVGYQFPSPVSVQQVALTAVAETTDVNTVGLNPPGWFLIQYSDDGVAYTDAMDVSHNGWYAGDVRTFTSYDGVPGVSFRSLLDAPHSYIDQAGRSVRVKADETGVEFYDLPLTPIFLGDLADVSADTGAPAEETVLTWKDGVWQAFTAQEPADRGEWGLLIVPEVVTFESGVMPALFSNATSSGWTIVTEADTGGGTTKALRAAPIGFSTSTEFTFDALAGGAYNNFMLRYRVSSETTHDPFIVFVDGVEVHRDSGPSGGWEEVTLPLAAGARTIKFRYQTDVNSAVGADTVFIGKVTVPVSGAPAPYIYGDVVTFGAGRYMCIASGTTDEPTVETAWLKLTEEIGHAYWRLLLHANNGYGAHVAQEIEFKNTRTGADLATGGTAIASSYTSVPSRAFDGTTLSWQASTANDGEWIGYHFADPVDVKRVSFQTSPTPTSAPVSFDVQWSDDGSTWTTSFSVSGQTAWTSEEIRWFSRPNEIYFNDLMDTPFSFVGQASKYLKVNSAATGVEYVSGNADKEMFIGGRPGADEIVLRIHTLSPYRVPTTGHAASSEVAPAGSSVFSLRKNGTQFGTCTFLGASATFSVSQTDFALNDILTVRAPTVSDANLSDISITLKALRT